MDLNAQMMQPPMGAPQGMGGPPMPPGMEGGPGPNPYQMGLEGPQGAPMGPGGPEVPQDDSGDLISRVNAAILSKNMAEKKKKELLDKIADEVIRGYEADLRSTSDWLKNNADWMKMALLFREPKSYPWPKASNVKYPLIATAAMQFSARAYPTLVPSDGQIVKARVVGMDPDGSREDRANRISKHMSYQIMQGMPDWEEDMDKLLMIAAIIGVCYKKTYIDEVLKTVVSELVMPEDLVINYWAKSVEKAYRKTEILPLTKNEYLSKVNSGEFLDVEIGLPSEATLARLSREQKPHVNKDNSTGEADESTPHLFLAQHTFYDLDDDGYAEPVVIVVHHDTRQVVRILARYAAEGVHLDEDKRVVRIDPIEYFTPFSFIPNPDGSIYSLGFGALLGPSNEAINSLINQLVDSGTLNNLQSGFLAKGLRIQMKETGFKPGEWKEANASGEDLKNGIFPIPTKEPSNVLFQLMNLLITSGNQLASVAEIFVGKMPGQNTPATTTQETVDQAMKVFTAIYKRMYRSLLKEIQKIYFFNSVSQDILDRQSKVLNLPLTVSDYQGEVDDIIPAADPAGNSLTVSYQKIMQLVQVVAPMGVLNMPEVAQRLVKLIELPDPAKLVQQPPPPPPDPKVESEKMKQQTMQQKAQIDGQAKQQEIEIKKQLAEMEMQVKQMELMMKQKEAEMDLQIQQMKGRMDMVTAQQKMQVDGARAHMDMQLAAKQGQMKIAQADAQHKQTLAQNDAAGKQKLEMQKKERSMVKKPKGDK